MPDHPRTVLTSLSAAMDGGLTAIADVATALAAVDAADDHRLIGGVAVMIHIQRLGLDVPLRATGDADFGVPPHVLRSTRLIESIEAAGYEKVFGNRWERVIDDRRVAAVDLLVPTYRSRARDTVRVGDVVTTEVPALAEALRRPAVSIDATLRLTDGNERQARVNLPDSVAMVALKACARTVRNQASDVEDIWRCLEIAAADNVSPEMFEGDEGLRSVRVLLARDLERDGAAMQTLVEGRSAAGAARLRTRVRALLVEVVGTDR